MMGVGISTGGRGSELVSPDTGEPVNGIGSLGSADCSLISDRATRDVAWRSRRCKGHKSLNLLVWNPWPKDCTSLIGRVTTWPAKPWRMELWLASAHAPCEIS